MPLQKQSIAVKFAGGVDTKTAEQLVVPGSFLRLDNCVRRKTGRIEKRNGFQNLGSTVAASGTAISTGLKVDTFNDNLVLIANDQIYSYLESTDQWIDQGDVPSVLVDSTPVVRNSFKQAQADIASLDGITVVVYEDSRTANTVRYSVYDDSTGTAIVFDASLGTNAERPRVVSIANNAFLLGWRNTSTSSLMTARIDLTDPAILTTFAAVETGAFLTGPWDLITSGQYALAAFNTSGSDTRLVPLNREGEVGTGLNGLPVPLSINAAGTNGIGVVRDDTGIGSRYWVAMASSTGVYTAVAPTSLATSYLSSEVLRTNVRNVTLAQIEEGEVTVFVEYGAPGTVAARKNQIVATIEVTYNGASTVTAGSLTTFKQSVGLGSKAWVYNDTFYVVCSHDSALQATDFVIRGDGYIVAKINSGLSGGLSQDTSDSLKTGIPSVWLDSSGSYVTALRTKNALRAAEDGSIVSSSVGIQKVALEFGSTVFDADTLGQNYHIAGGVLLGYDGVSATELGFHLYPEDVTVAQGAAGTLPNGTYYYAAVYEWQDARGQIHRSAPSVIVSATVTSSSNDAVTISVPSLRLTAKTGTRADVKVVLYSGVEGDDTILYRLTETTNDPTSPTVDLTDSAPRSATFTTGEVLYTTGGVLDSIAPPACKVVTNHKNRLFLAGLEDGNSVAYSREHVFGEGVNFSDFLSFKVDPRGGPITALGSLDDKLVIFKRDAIFTLVGDGPVDTGAQNDYANPQLVSSDVGCVDPRSVVITPEGLMFRSDKGIYTLTRALQTVDTGGRVDDYNIHTVTSAVVMEDASEVRFTTEDGPCLVYNYEFDQWSTFQNYEAVSACRGLGGSYIHLKSDGTVRKENDGYNDAGSRYSMAIETSWMSFGDLQGYQRVYYAMGLGDYLSDHHTRVKIAYDFEDSYSETVYFNVDTDSNISYYGDDATYGDSSVYGGSGVSIYQWYLRPRRQKCQSLKLLIEDVDTISSNGDASFNFVGLTFMAGIKNGGPRVRGGQEIGR